MNEIEYTGSKLLLEVVLKVIKKTSIIEYASKVNACM